MLQHHRVPELLRRGLAFLLPLGLVAACSGVPSGQQILTEISPTRAFAPELDPRVRAMYGAMPDGDFLVPAIAARHLSPENIRREVDYWSNERPGTIVVDPWDRFLYLVQEGNRAIRYRIGVGEMGRNFSGSATIRRKAEWPTWTPTPRMLREEPEINEPWRAGMPGGLENPLGARALYLYRNGRDTLYRIHGTHAPWSIGQGVSAGCIRLFNQDAIDLYERVSTGARVVVLRENERGRGTVPPGGLVARGEAVAGAG
jgi:lipoprotein-anchoring transpeptidase ErfK/SrfK